MATYQRETVVDAPFDRVWTFYSRIEGLVALTPGFLNLEVHRVTGPDGESDQEFLDTGTRIESSMRPFGVGPRQHWTSIVTVREESEGEARLQDVMRDGPFPTWEHTHEFVAEDDGTRVVDRVEYELPGGPLGRVVSPFGWPGFEAMFRYRHRRTRELLED